MTVNKNKNGGSNMDSIMAQEEAEVGHFWWDNSNEDETEAMKEAEKEDEKNGTKWKQPEKERQ
eukprot:2249876-Ditylum_brightwellii.AAC.1